MIFQSLLASRSLFKFLNLFSWPVFQLLCGYNKMSLTETMFLPSSAISICVEEEPPHAPSQPEAMNEQVSAVAPAEGSRPC